MIGSGSGREGGWDKMGRVEGGAIIIKIYCTRQESVFTKRKKENKQGLTKESSLKMVVLWELSSS